MHSNDAFPYLHKACVHYTPVTVQKKWIFEWVEKRTSFPCQFDLIFYASRFDNDGFFSIFPVGKLG